AAGPHRAGRRAGRSATLRWYACRAHGRDRPHRRAEDRKQGQAEPADHHRAGRAGIGAEYRPPPLAGGGWGEGSARKTLRCDPGANPSPQPPPARGGGEFSMLMTMEGRAMQALVTTDWLAGELGKPDLVVFDATKYLPNEPKDGRTEFRVAHIPGARYFDIDEVADPDTDLPHMVPSPGRFANLMGALGVG